MSFVVDRCILVTSAPNPFIVNGISQLLRHTESYAYNSADPGDTLMAIEHKRSSQPNENHLMFIVFGSSPKAIAPFEDVVDACQVIPDTTTMLSILRWFFELKRSVLEHYPTLAEAIGKGLPIFFFIVDRMLNKAGTDASSIDFVPGAFEALDALAQLAGCKVLIASALEEHNIKPLLPISVRIIPTASGQIFRDQESGDDPKKRFTLASGIHRALADHNLDDCFPIFFGDGNGYHRIGGVSGEAITVDAAEDRVFDWMDVAPHPYEIVQLLTEIVEKKTPTPH